MREGTNAGSPGAKMATDRTATATDLLTLESINFSAREEEREGEMDGRGAGACRLQFVPPPNRFLSSVEFPPFPSLPACLLLLDAITTAAFILGLPPRRGSIVVTQKRITRSPVRCSD